MFKSENTNNNFLNLYNKGIYFIIGFFILVSLIAAITYGCLTNYYVYIWSSLISIPFILITPFIHNFASKFLLKFAKNNQAKTQVIYLSILLFVCKYIFLFLGLIIGVSINFCCELKYFDILTLILFPSIHPISTVICLFIFKN